MKPTSLKVVNTFMLNKFQNDKLVIYLDNKTKKALGKESV